MYSPNIDTQVKTDLEIFTSSSQYNIQVAASALQSRHSCLLDSLKHRLELT